MARVQHTGAQKGNKDKQHEVMKQESSHTEELPFWIALKGSKRDNYWKAVGMLNSAFR